MSAELSAVNYRARIEGIRPLICHNGQLADPLSEIPREIKKISGIRKKTDEAYEAMARLEWVGGLYLDDDRRPIVTGLVLDGMLCESGKKSKLGKTIKSAVEVLDSPLIEHDGPKNATVEDFIDKPRYRHAAIVRVGSGSRIVRTRPIFPVWALEFDIQIDTDAIDPGEVQKSLEIGGRLVGLCDWRPRFGKFALTKFEKAE